MKPVLTFGLGKYGCRKVQVHPAESGEQLGRDPSKIGSSKSLVLESFSGEGTLWDSSLPVTLTLWDTPVLCMPSLPLSQDMLCSVGVSAEIVSRYRAMRGHYKFGGVEIQPPKLRGESSKTTFFTAFSGAHSPNLGGEIFTPRIWGYGFCCARWEFRPSPPPKQKKNLAPPPSVQTSSRRLYLHPASSETCPLLFQCKSDTPPPARTPPPFSPPSLPSVKTLHLEGVAARNAWKMTAFPVGQKRHLDVAGQKFPRDNFCLSVVSQLPSPRG